MNSWTDEKHIPTPGQLSYQCQRIDWGIPFKTPELGVYCTLFQLAKWKTEKFWPFSKITNVKIMVVHKQRVNDIDDTQDSILGIAIANEEDSWLMD